MCLISSYKVPKVAEDPIICYKVLALTCNVLTNEITYVTPFQNCVVEKDVLEGRVEMVAVGDGDVDERDFRRIPEYAVGEGFIHCYTSVCDAETYVHVKRWERSHSCYVGVEYFVFKCEIPVGTEYFMSKDGLTICAKKIRFVQKEY